MKTRKKQTESVKACRKKFASSTWP